MVYRLISLMSSPDVLRRLTVNGIEPGSECVAHALHGSYARNAISTMFNNPSLTTPSWIRLFAAFSTLMAMRE